ncbi:thioredoxin domain-containing protein 9 [Chelonus insularis]|uniref:thioredoxin domain-containing protein 9 n=1 Tax=Chelonus insularis TaxID=460826 RepID=UPI00158A2F6C|nr:thioredoxin domain-containing protein 9 [Chelonus insularis]
MEATIQQTILNVANQVEQQIDDQLEQLDKLDADDLEKLRAKRLEELKRIHQQKQAWLKAGHGEYVELPDEKEFFNVSKKSKNIVCLFYKDDSFRSKIVDKHLHILAKQHIETLFCKVNVMKCPFLTDRLKIKVIPTIALIKDGKTKDYIVGFTDLGNCDDFSTEMLEWRIAHSGVINYSGDLLKPPDNAKSQKSSLLKSNSKVIRDKCDSDNGSDED